jgi:predicted transcriptional regulator
MSLFKKNLELVDPDTGEKVGQTPFLTRKKANLEGTFIMMRQEGCLRLAKEKDLTGADRRVLDILWGNVDYENYIQIDQQAIANDLEMRKQHVSRSINKLIEKGILIKGTKVGRHNTYRLNPFYGWKGKADKEFHDFYDKHARRTQG